MNLGFLGKLKISSTKLGVLGRSGTSCLLELAAIGDDHVLAGLPVWFADGLHRLDDLDALGHLAEDDVLAVEPGRIFDADKELRALGVGPSVGHRQSARAAVRDVEVLVVEPEESASLSCTLARDGF